MKVKLLRRILLHALLFPIFPALLDTSYVGASDSPKPDPDGWIRTMNKFMPLKGEILVIGANGVFGSLRDFAILEHLGREVVGVSDCPPEGNLQWIKDDARRLAEDRDLHVMIVDPFSETKPLNGRPIIERILVLSVSTEDGEIELVDYGEGNFTGSMMHRPSLLDEAVMNHFGFDQYLVVRVLGHAFPD